MNASVIAIICIVLVVFSVSILVGSPRQSIVGQGGKVVERNDLGKQLDRLAKKHDTELLDLTTLDTPNVFRDSQRKEKEYVYTDGRLSSIEVEKDGRITTYYIN